MFRRSLSLSLILPLGFLLLILMFAVYVDRALHKIPEIHTLSTVLIGLIVAWIPISFYFRIRLRILTPLRELRQKFQRAGKDRLEIMTPPASKDEINDVVVGYNQMVTALLTEREEKQRMERERLLESQLIALGIQADGLVHELSSPLSALSTLATLASEGDAESAKHLVSETRSLNERLKRFMGLFRERKVTVKLIGLGRVIAERIDLMDQSRVQFRFDSPQESMEIFSDEVLLAEILDNLLKNAERHAKSKVVVAADRADGFARVIVTDDGVGIPSGHAEKLFRPFFTTANGGHGLGLFVSRLWAQALGGRLELASPRHSVLGGASFQIVLPTKRPE